MKIFKFKLNLKYLFGVLLCFTIMFGLAFPTVLARPNTNATTNSVVIPFQKTWDDNNDIKGFRTENISVSLYKYNGDEFCIDSATLIETKTISANDNWECNFNIPNNEVFDSNGNAYSFKIIETKVDKYEETEHIDPTITFNPPNVGTWGRITPCSELQIKTKGSIVVVKKGNNYVIWTMNELSPTEKKIVFDSAKENINGFGQGNFKNATFINGVGSSYKGVIVTQDKIIFDKPSSWSFFATSVYNESYIEVNGGKITNTLAYESEIEPTEVPTPAPTEEPTETLVPTEEPEQEATLEPTELPQEPTIEPSQEPIVEESEGTRTDDKEDIVNPNDELSNNVIEEMPNKLATNDFYKDAIHIDDVPKTSDDTSTLPILIILILVGSIICLGILLQNIYKLVKVGK